MRPVRLLLAMTLAAVVTSVVWAVTVVQGDVVISPGNAALSGQRTRIVTLSNSSFTVTRGKANVIQGINLYDLEQIDPDHIDTLRVRFYLRNPQDMGRVLYSPNSYIEVFLTPRDDSETVYASGIVSREQGYAVLRPVISNLADITESDTGLTLRLRASVVVPGGRPPGMQEKEISDLQTYVQMLAR